MRILSVDANRGDPHDVRGSDSRNNQQSDLTLTASDKGPAKREGEGGGAALASWLPLIAPQTALWYANRSAKPNVAGPVAQLVRAGRS
jgi:hypothetical protein